MPLPLLIYKQLESIFMDFFQPGLYPNCFDFFFWTFHSIFTVFNEKPGSPSAERWTHGGLSKASLSLVAFTERGKTCRGWVSLLLCLQAVPWYLPATGSPLPLSVAPDSGRIPALLKADLLHGCCLKWRTLLCTLCAKLTQVNALLLGLLGKKKTLRLSRCKGTF